MGPMGFGRRRREGGRRSLLAPLVVALTLVALLATAAPAGAGLRNDLEKFSTCPLTTFGVSKCVYSETTSGQFVLGNATVPVSRPVIIQGGLNGSGEIVPPTSGEELSRTPLPIPGGLLGIELIGNLTEVTATAELAGTASITTDVSLPLKTKLDNPLLGGVLLGPNCYVGTNAEPISLHMTYGKLELVVKDHAIDDLIGTLEDHTFAAPGASGCSALPIIVDPSIDLKEGLPSPSGKNSAELTGSTEQVSRRLVIETLPLPAFSRCEKLPGEPEGKKLVFKGRYVNSACTTASVVNEGHYEWHEGPGANKTFTGASGPVTIESVGGKTNVKCAASKASGEYTGPKTETQTITLTGCETGPHGHVVTCQSGSTAGEIVTNQLQGGLDFIKENYETGLKPEVGLQIKAASGTELASFECGGTHITVSGSQIAPITGVDAMVTSFKVNAKQSNGTPGVTAFEEGAKGALTITGASGEESGALGIAETQTNGEKLEVKAEP